MCGRDERKPHTHVPNVTMCDDGDIRIQYGDQNRHFVYRFWPGWQARIGRVLRRQIRRHDRMSRKAMVGSNVIQVVREQYPLHERSGYWATEILKNDITASEDALKNGSQSLSRR